MNAGGIGSGVGLILSWLLTEWLTARGIEMPKEVQIAIIGLATGGIGYTAGYFIRDRACE